MMRISAIALSLAVPLLVAGDDALAMMQTSHPEVHAALTQKAALEGSKSPEALSQVHAERGAVVKAEAEGVPVTQADLTNVATGLHAWKAAFIKSFIVVSIAELFDKTWFMSLILAVRHGWKTTLAGAYVGLLLHCVLSALLGFGFAKLLAPYVLHFITAGLFFLFMGLYAKDWYEADPEGDMIQSGQEEAAEGLGEENEAGAGGYGSTGAPSAEKKSEGGCMTRMMKAAKGMSSMVVMQCFISVFIAEWGDRTQFAMIGLHSSLPVIPVFIGSALAFFMLTGSAVAAAAVISVLKISERMVFAVASISFGVFAVLALMDGLKELHPQHAGLKVA